VDFFAAVREIVVDHLGIVESDVKPESKFTNDLGADYLDMFEMVMALEKKYGIKIPDVEVRKIVTVSDAIKAIEERIKNMR
jgi:acyl carrier protein